MEVVVASPTPPQQLQASLEQLKSSPEQLEALSQPLLVVDSSLEDERELKTPKKRAETWVQDEIKALIALRKEMDTVFNTSKSKKHLWDQMSTKMKERGYERSPMMCTDKWRNLLKEFKKAKHQGKGGGSAKAACYKDLEELLGDRAKAQTPAKIETPSSLVTPRMKVTARSALKLDHDGHPTAVPSTDAMDHGGVMPPSNGITPSQRQWNWRDSNSNGGERRPPGNIIVVKCAELSRRIRVDGPFESIKESIKAALGIRSKRAFWLEDEEGIVQTLSPDMPSGEYTLNLDQGITVEICACEGDRLTSSTESKTFYTEDEFHELLIRKGWAGLREVGSVRDVDSLEELRTGAIYQQAGILVDEKQ